VARRASVTMVLLGSFLGYASTAVIKNDGGMAAKLTFALTHPSVLIGLAGMFFLLWCEMAKVKRADDLITRIVFTEEPLLKLSNRYFDASRPELFREMIANVRLVGGLLRKKVFFYNVGSLLFVLAITAFVAGF
jgi:hypothetical protein